MPHNTVSIILCTRDRAESLRETLHAIDECLVPGDLAVEVLVVDNGSRDRTRPVVRQATCWGKSPRYIFEPRSGLSNARNAGLTAAQGEVLLWTDDDVRPGGHWIEAMCRPLLDDQADAVAGRVRLPDYLERPWLRGWHRVCLAVDVPKTGDFELVGANMAFARRVLEKVPAFDPELGVGALGACEETLFSQQLRTAGFRLMFAGEDSTVEHHCGEARLTHNSMAGMLARQGRSQAYVDYHWLHRKRSLAALRGAKSSLALAGLSTYRRLRRVRVAVIGRLEARWLWRSAYYSQLLIESRRPRQYAFQGLEKLAISISSEEAYATSLRGEPPRRAA